MKEDLDTFKTRSINQNQRGVKNLESSQKGIMSEGASLLGTDKSLNTKSGLIDIASDLFDKGQPVLKKILKHKSKMLAIGILFFVFGTLIIIMLPMMMLMNIDVFGFLKNDPDVAKQKVFLYADKVVADYEADGLYLDRNLILSTITALKSMEDYGDDSLYLGNDKVSSAKVRELKKKVDIAAAYQVKRITDCKYPSNTVREIAMNDASGYIDFFESEAELERNYECVSGAEGVRKVVSVEEGSFEDDNSGGVFFWNLYDGEFIDTYFKDELKEATEIERDEFKRDFIELVYAQRDMFSDFTGFEVET